MSTTTTGESGPGETSDIELIREVKKGRRESFDRLVLRHQRRVYSIALRMTGSHDDADDLAQETFLAAYRAMERFDERHNFVAFLSRIAINLSINHLRRRKRWHKIETQKAEEAVHQLMGAGTEGPQQDMERQEIVDKLNGALRALPPNQKAVLILKVYQGLSYEQIAATLKISMGTVMSRLHRARARLRAELEDVL